MKKMEKFFIITLVAGLIAFSSSIPTQMVHALSAKLPVGSWTITVGKGTNVATKSTLNIIGVGSTGTVSGTYASQAITGKYTSNSQFNLLEWHKNVEPNTKYTGYLILEPGCNQIDGGGVCNYTLAGYKFVPGFFSGGQAGLSNTNGWYAQIKVIIPTPPPQ